MELQAKRYNTVRVEVRRGTNGWIVEVVCTHPGFVKTESVFMDRASAVEYAVACLSLRLEVPNEA